MTWIDGGVSRRVFQGHGIIRHVIRHHSARQYRQLVRAIEIAIRRLASVTH
jgi:hypothetical protein